VDEQQHLRISSNSSYNQNLDAIAFEPAKRQRLEELRSKFPMKRAAQAEQNEQYRNRKEQRLDTRY
jgi:hypothetical protein